MRKNIATLAVLAVTGVGTLAAVPSSQAASTGVDVSMTGSVVAGVTSAQSGQKLAFVFTVRNNSTTTSTDTSFTFTVRHGWVPAGGYICPLASSGFDINPDGASCEIGALGPGKTTRAAIVVQTPNTTGVTMSVQACGSDLDGSTDPNPGNNCATLAVPIS